MVSKERIIAIICSYIILVTCISYIASNIVPQWASREVEGVKLTIGLWSVCELNSLGMVCQDWPLTCSNAVPQALHACNKMMVSRVFVTIACIISALSALFLFAYGLIYTNSDHVVIIISKILLLVSSIAGLIGVSVGIAFVTGSLLEYELAVSGIIGIIAVIINAITTVVTITMIQ